MKYDVKEVLTETKFVRVELTNGDIATIPLACIIKIETSL